jgi:hypothetical protein
MEILYKLLTMIWTCMQNFRTLSSIDICKQIFLYLSSYNFVPCIIVKMMMWLSFLGRATHKESHKNYFIIFLTFIHIPTDFGNLYEFLWIYKVLQNS